MEHDVLQNQIPDYVAGRLDDAARLRLEAHLPTCQDCRELVECGEALAAEFSEQAEPDAPSHPEPSELRAHALRPRARIAEHLESCPSCVLEVAIARRRLESPGRPWVRPLLAGAALGAAASIGVVLVWWGGSPGPSTSGAPDWIVLEEPRRGEPSVKSVAAAADRTLLVGVRFTLPSDAGDDVSFHFTVEDAEGAVAWRLALTGGEIRHRQRATGLVLLQVPAGTVRAGRWTLTVERGDRSAEGPWLAVPFDVEE